MNSFLARPTTVPTPWGLFVLTLVFFAASPNRGATQENAESFAPPSYASSDVVAGSTDLGGTTGYPGSSDRSESTGFAGSSDRFGSAGSPDRSESTNLGGSTGYPGSSDRSNSTGSPDRSGSTNFAESTGYPGSSDRSDSTGFAGSTQTNRTPNFSGTLDFSPSIVAKRTYYEGAETIGRVGYESILKSDILHQLKKMAYATYLEQLDKVMKQEIVQTFAPEELDEQKAKLRQAILDEYLNNSEIYSNVLDHYIRGLLYYNDFVVSRPKDQITEQRKHLAEAFETEQIPLLLKQLRCDDRKELEKIFKEELGSSLAQEKRIFVQELLGGSWMTFNLGNDTFEPTAVDLRRYYDARRQLYEEPARVRWQGMSVSVANHPSREDAYNKLVQMGNSIPQARNDFDQEQAFAEVARQNSEDFFASKGGIRDWTLQGALHSKKIEDALFNQELPVGRMSRIIDDGDSFVIVRVLERDPVRWKPFVEVQEDVREKLLQERRESLQKKYEEALSRRYTIELYDVAPSERRSIVESAQNKNVSATGRERF